MTEYIAPDDFYQDTQTLPQKGDVVISPHGNTVIIESPARPNHHEKNLIGIAAYYSKELIFVKRT